MERYGIVRDGLLLWLECRAEADRFVKQYGGRIICEHADEVGESPAGAPAAFPAACPGRSAGPWARRQAARRAATCAPRVRDPSDVARADTPP